jgi:hypothetical protein
MGAGESVIVQSEDIQNKYDAGIIDLTNACKKDVICPPSKFISTFTNYTDKYTENDYIFFILLIMLFIFIIYKYI